MTPVASAPQQLQRLITIFNKPSHLGQTMGTDVDAMRVCRRGNTSTIT